MRKILTALLAAAVALSLSAAAMAAKRAPGEPGAMPQAVETAISEIDKYGNILLDVSCTGLFERGYAWGDIVDVTILGQRYEMPVASNFNEVDSGGMVCRAVLKEDLGEDYTVLAINMGDLATDAGVATRENTDSDPGYIWHYNAGVSKPVAVSIEMKEPCG